MDLSEPGAWNTGWKNYRMWEYISLKRSVTVEQTMEYARKHAKYEKTINALFVTDPSSSQNEKIK